MLAILVAVYIWADYINPAKGGLVLNIFTDNMGCVSVAQKFYSKKEPLSSIFKCLSILMINKNIWLKFHHIPGERNTVADELSRDNKVLFDSHVIEEITVPLVQQIMASLVIPSKIM